MRYRFYGWRHYLLISQGCRRRRRPAEAQCTQSLGLGYKLCAIIPVAGQRTHGTTFRALKVTSRVATTGTESAVYDCFVDTRRILRGTGSMTRSIIRPSVSMSVSSFDSRSGVRRVCCWAPCRREISTDSGVCRARSTTAPHHGAHQQMRAVSC